MKRIISIVSFLGLIISSSLSTKNALVNAANSIVEKDSINYLNVEFESNEDSNLFESFYSADGESAIAKSFSDNWKIENGKLSCTSNFGYSTLILKDYGLQNYEMSVDYTPDSGDGYLALLSKVRTKGLSSRGVGASEYKEYGNGVFVSNSGVATMQGDYRSLGLEDSEGIIHKTITGYNSSLTHNLYIKCFNNEYTMKVDGNVVIEKVAGGGIGFMGLQSYKSKGSFDNLQLHLLDFDGTVKDLVPDDNVTRIACIGDSLTFGSQDGKYIVADTIPGQLQKMLGKNYDVRNFGLGGRTVIRGSGSCIMDDAEYELARNYKADIIYMMFGTNDSQTTGGYWGTDEEAGAKLFMDGYQDLIDGLKEVCPNATYYLVISPTYRHKTLEQLTEQMIATRARVYTPKVAQENGFKVIDANEVTKDIDTSHLFDYIHFDAYGYGLIANAYYKQLSLDVNETLTMPYSQENPINLKIGDSIVLSQTSYTNPRYSIVNSSIGTIDEITGKIEVKAAGKTQVIAKLGNQSVSMPLNVSNGFVMPIISPSKSIVTYGESLPTLVADGPFPVAGSLEYEEHYDLKIGTNTYNYVFTPADTKYIPEHGSVTITCNKAQTSIEAPYINAKIGKPGDTLSSISLPDGFVWENPDLELHEGKNNCVVLYESDDLEHYESQRFDVVVRIIYANEGNENVPSNGCNGSVGFSIIGLVALLAIISKRKEK